MKINKFTIVVVAIVSVLVIAIVLRIFLTSNKKSNSIDLNNTDNKNDIVEIIIPQYNWGIFISAYKALILAG